MIKSSTADIHETTFISKVYYVFKKLSRIYFSIKNVKILSEDTIYKLNFTQKFSPEMYNRHIANDYKNCIFCYNLEKSGYRNHCFKCSAGTYIHGSPLLPGFLNSEYSYPHGHENSGIPWYFKKVCSSFTRLPQNNYLRNFGSVFSPASIYKFEVLEGLEKGLSAGERPCHVCALANYDIYKNCSSCKDFDKYSPCNRITSILSDFYNT